MTYPVTRSALGLPILVLSGVQLLMVLDGTVVLLALPRLQDELGLSDAGRNWVVTSYALTFGGLMLLGGRLGDAYGRKRMFLGGVGLFTVSSLLCGVAMNETMLVAARALQGTGAAIASPTALALVATTFAPGKVRNQAIAIFAAMTGIGSVSGLIIGGLLTELSWRWVFLINVPIGAAIIAGALLVLRDSAHHRLQLDIAGSVLGTLACTALVFGGTEGPELGWGDPAVIGSFVAGAVLLVAFLVVERTADNPLLPFRLFHDPSRVATLIAIFFGFAGLTAMTLFVALFIQNVLKYSPLHAGIAFVPFAIGIGAGSALASNLVARVAPRWLVLAGAAIMVAGLLDGSTLDGTVTYWPHLFVLVVGIGFGVGFVAVPLPLCAIAGVRHTEIGPLTAVGQVAQTLSGPIAIAVVGALATSRTLSLGGSSGDPAEMNDAQLGALGEGYTFALVGCAAFVAVAGLIALLIRFTPAQVADAQEHQHELVE